MTPRSPIDFDYHRARARELRREAITAFGRKVSALWAQLRLGVLRRQPPTRYIALEVR